MKILEVNGLKYSRSKFEGYLHRAAIVLEKDGDPEFLHIYTTDSNKSSIINTVTSRLKKGVSFVRLDYLYTKKQDDVMSNFYKELIRGIDP